MSEVFIQILKIALPVFVFVTMFNIGLIQRLSEIINYIRDFKFDLCMFVANFFLAPLLMWAMLQLKTVASNSCPGNQNHSLLKNLTLTFSCDYPMLEATGIQLHYPMIGVATLLMPGILDQFVAGHLTAHAIKRKVACMLMMLSGGSWILFRTLNFFAHIGLIVKSLG